MFVQRKSRTLKENTYNKRMRKLRLFDEIIIENSEESKFLTPFEGGDQLADDIKSRYGKTLLPRCRVKMTLHNVVI